MRLCVEAAGKERIAFIGRRESAPGGCQSQVTGTAATLPEQVLPLASLTVITTLPVGVPLLGPFTVTVKLTVTTAPVPDGSGSSKVMVVVVDPWLTVIAPVAAALNPVPIASDDACALKLPAAMELRAGVNFNPALPSARVIKSLLLIAVTPSFLNRLPLAIFVI